MADPVPQTSEERGASAQRTLTQAALEALQEAAAVGGAEEPRQIRRPDTWLLRRCWQALADHGAPAAAFHVLRLVSRREPLALFRALPRLARRAHQEAGLAVALEIQLDRMRPLVRRPRRDPLHVWAEHLLSLACAAAHLDDEDLALACLERLDQEAGVWDTVVAQERLRELLAEIIGLVGLHPLTGDLLQQAVDRYDTAGASLVRQVAVYAAAGHPGEPNRRLLHHCVEVFRRAALVSLEARRHAVVVLALEGRVDEILDQIRVMASVQEARRESSLFEGGDDDWLVRQVRRFRADPDVDFRFYALKEAVDHLAASQVPPEQLRLLAETIAFHGMQSDGWTAAAAVQTLLRLGSVEQAKSVVNHLDPRDTTRSEAYRALIEGLLSQGQVDDAAEQARLALIWARTLASRNTERLLLWNLARAFLQHRHPARALALLRQHRRFDLWHRMRRLLDGRPDEDRVREEVLLLHAALLGDPLDVDQAMAHLANIRRWGPQTWPGRLLALFYLETVLETLLETGHDDLVWAFLPDIQQALDGLQGRELPARLEELSLRLVARLRQMAPTTPDPGPSQGASEAREILGRFLMGLWKDSAAQGVWRMVYALGGTLPLLIALEGSEAVVSVAELAAREGSTWLAPVPQSEDGASDALQPTGSS